MKGAKGGEGEGVPTTSGSVGSPPPLGVKGTTERVSPPPLVVWGPHHLWEQRGVKGREGSEGGKGEQRGAKGGEGSEGSEGGRRGAKGAKGSEGGEGISTLGFRVPTTCDGKKFDNIIECLGVPTTCKNNHYPMCIHRAARGLRRSPPPAQNFGAKTANRPLR